MSFCGERRETGRKDKPRPHAIALTARAGYAHHDRHSEGKPTRGDNRDGGYVAKSVRASEVARPDARPPFAAKAEYNRAAR